MELNRKRVIPPQGVGTGKWGFYKVTMSAMVPLLVFTLAYAGPEGDSSYIFVDLSETQTRTLPSKIMLKPQTTCPVMNKPVDKKLYVDYRGKRMYVCCPGCIEKVRKNPKKYIDILAGMGQGVEAVLFPDEGQKPAKKRPLQKDTASGNGENR
jgi:YHS domain-containing protein